MVHDTEAFDTLFEYYLTAERQLQDLLDEYIRLKRLRKTFKRRQVRVWAPMSCCVSVGSVLKVVRRHL